MSQTEDLCKALSNMGLSALEPFLTELEGRVAKLETAPPEPAHLKERKEAEAAACKAHKEEAEPAHHAAKKHK